MAWRGHGEYLVLGDGAEATVFNCRWLDAEHLYAFSRDGRQRLQLRRPGTSERLLERSSPPEATRSWRRMMSQPSQGAPDVVERMSTWVRTAITEYGVIPDVLHAADLAHDLASRTRGLEHANSLRQVWQGLADEKGPIESAWLACLDASIANRQGNSEEAITSLQAACKGVSGKADSYALLGFVLPRLGSLLQGESRFREAAAVYAEAIPHIERAKGELAIELLKPLVCAHVDALIRGENERADGYMAQLLGVVRWNFGDGSVVERDCLAAVRAWLGQDAQLFADPAVPVAAMHRCFLAERECSASAWFRSEFEELDRLEAEFGLLNSGFHPRPPLRKQRSVWSSRWGKRLGG